MTRRSAARTFGVFAVLAVASCLGDGTGPAESRHAHITLAPVFDARALKVVDVNRILIRFARPATGAIAYETIVNFPATSDTLDITVDVPIAGGTSEQFDLSLLMIDDPAGDTVFRAGPTLITATAGAAPTTAPAPIFVYTGTGANATGVRFVTTPPQVFFGDTVQFTAEAFDANNLTIPNTPIVWSSSDLARALVPDPSIGRVVGGTARGNADVKAELLRTSTQATPPFATRAVLVQPKPSVLVVQGGSGQTGTVGAPLSQPVTVRVKAVDNLGVQGVVVTFAVVTGGGSLSQTAVTTDANGDAAVTWTLGAALGTQQVSASVAGLTSATVPANGVVGSASKVAFTTQPATGNAGAAIPAVQVTAQDLLGNIVTTFTGNVTIAIGANPGSATLSGTTTVAAVGGVATFSNLILSAAGTGYTLTAASTGLTGATSATFDIVNNAATQLAFVTQPTATTAGSAFTPAVQVAVRNSIGGTVTTATNSVTIVIASNPGGGTLGGTVSVAAVNGIATFSNLSIDRTGAGYTLAANASGLTSATSAAFDVTSGAPQTLSFTVPPSTAVAGSVMAPAIVVRALDPLGNTATGFTGNVTLALGANPGGATLSGTTSVNAVAGVATFANVSLDKVAAGYTLAAAASGLTGATSAAFAVAPAAANALVFTVQPLTTTAGATLAPALVVTAMDAFGNTATTFAGNVTVAIGSNPGGATLSGTATVAAVAGVATFNNLTITARGAGYTITASAAGVTGATSLAFDISALTLSWINAAGGLWSSAANWSLGRVPQTTDSVVIALPGTYTVTLDATFSASFLIVGGATGTQTLSLSSRTLTVSGSMMVAANGVFSATSSTVAGAGTVTNQGAVNLISSTISGPLDNQGLLLIGGTVALNGALTTGAGSTLRVQGGLASTGSLTVANGFTNNALIDLTAINGGFTAQLVVTTGTLTNAVGATINSAVGTGGLRTLAAQLNNQGALALAQPLTLTRASAAHTNSGTIDASTVNFTLTQSGTAPSFANTGTITVGAGRVWTVTGGTLDLSAGTVSGAGLLSVSGGTVLSFSTTTVTTPLTLSGISIPAGITIPSGQTLTLLNGSIDDPVTIGTGGTLLIGGTVALNGALTPLVGSTLRVQGGLSSTGALAVANGFTNNGAVELTSINGGFSTQLSVTTGTLTNAAGGIITSLTGTGGTRTIQAQLDNQGTLTLFPLAAGRLVITGSLTTSGIVDIELGGTSQGSSYDHLQVSGAATLGGTLNLSLINAFVPSPATAFTVLTSGALTGTFTLGTQPGGWAPPTYPANSVRLTAP